MINVVILGNGNMAWHLCNVFTQTIEVKVVQQYHYREQDPEFEAFDIEFTNDLQQLKSAEFYILAVSDDAISSLSDQLPVLDGIVLHTSGSVSVEVLNSKNRNGVFYPLQTLRKGQQVDFSAIPVCLEAIHKEDLQAIKELATKISNVTREISSSQRRSLHLAAVYVNNFVNHLYSVAFEICENEGIETGLLHALILETANKISINTPDESQTGPAKRGDLETIKKHLAMLDGDKAIIYKTLSDSILEKYGRKKL